MQEKHIFFSLILTKAELLALTPADFDFQACTIRINKSYQRLEGKDIITDPKTVKSNRIITMPEFLSEELESYIGMLYGLNENDRIFQISKSYLHHEMDRGVKLSGVKRIRIHDLRYPNHYKIQTFSIDAVYAVGFFEKKVWILFLLFGTPQPTEINQ